MKAKMSLLIVSCVTASLALAMCTKKKEDKHMLFRSYSSAQVMSLFPLTVEAIEKRTQDAMRKAQDDINALIAIADDQRTYQNTVKALDEIGAISDLAITAPAIHLLEMVSPDEAMRNAAQAAMIKMQEFIVDALSNNVELYNALMAYANGNARNEQLTTQQQYFLDKTIQDFKRDGLDLPADERQALKTLKKELAALELSFGANIAQDNRTLLVSRQALQGLEDDFIASLKQNDAGEYILGVDYPTYFAVMENCSVEKTRKDLMHMFENRAYPINDSTLNNIVAKRDQLAKKLGFATYSDLDLSNQMVKTQSNARTFINDLLTKAQIKEEQEFASLIEDLPAGVTLTVDGKLKPWDMMYAKNQYKKKHFEVDEQKIAEYFPMEKTVQGLLDIYQKFFSIQFKQVPVSGAWHSDVSMLEIYNAQGTELLGYFLLDLYPRPNKYGHACEITIMPATYHNEAAIPAVALVIANFPKSTATKPSLLKRKDVVTFFHEFGHALHSLLGRTRIASLSGTSVKWDFVEMPSQMLEEWLADAQILKFVSSHYITGQSLPDDLINRILALKNFSSGAFVSGQLMYALLSLDIFEQGENKNIHALYKKLHERCKKHVSYNSEDHMYVAFGHLTGYGAKYYGYMWSKVFALDLFYQIKKAGLLNPVIGSKYVHEVIGKGGSEDPNLMLKNFLGREPNQEAFLKDLGL